MVENVRHLILRGEFLEAHKYVHTFDHQTLEQLLVKIGTEKESFCAYTFIYSLLLKQETVELHRLAVHILTQVFPTIAGSFVSALHHARRLVELAPDNKDFLKNLLLFNEIPEKLISDQEAEEIRRHLKFLPK